MQMPAMYAHEIEAPRTSQRRVTEVLSTIDDLESDATGELRCLAADGVVAGIVFIERGRVAWAAAPGLARRLRHLLCEQKGCDVDAEQLEDIRKQCAQTGEPFGERLVKSGLVTEAQLRAALLEHSCESLLSSAESTTRLVFQPRPSRGYGATFTFSTGELAAVVGGLLKPGVLVSARALLTRLDAPERSVVVLTRGDGAGPCPVASSQGSVFSSAELHELGTWVASALDLSSALGASPRIIAATTNARAMVALLPEGDLCGVITAPERAMGRVWGLLASN